MGKTLWKFFFDAYDEALMIPWKIYGNNSKKLLCDDYISLTNNDTLDALKVIRCTNKDSYWEIVVED